MMRSFLEDLGKRLGETAESVTNKAGEAMEIQKLKSQIRALERENDSDLAELGLTVYDQFKDGAEVGEEAEALCEAIQNRDESIAECLQKIAEVKGDFRCEECGENLGKGMAYCPYCGAKAPENVQAETVDYAEAAKEKAADIIEGAADLTKEASEKLSEAAAKAGDAVQEKVKDAADKLRGAEEAETSEGEEETETEAEAPAEEGEAETEEAAAEDPDKTEEEEETVKEQE